MANNQCGEKNEKDKCCAAHKRKPRRAHKFANRRRSWYSLSQNLKSKSLLCDWWISKVSVLCIGNLISNNLTILITVDLLCNQEKEGRQMMLVLSAE